MKLMARRKIQNRNTRKLSESGQGSISITLPIEQIRKLKWRKGQKVVVERRGETLVIKDWKK
ncbi:MAG: hypothetical protein COU09_01715 [Candidatus Harrisonbacteria bacterium CG10_big_fil_rev_8_21_14_0_10_44_23]|uniref:SpoVT-AbrB domain-containing protein n=1 Tax=Candidatus Harrisonbacteria bacterium CG10_big_fil_rev_8_21_14_0_10_44_23 TaxID=1974585 RepID=A0A2H0UQA1_9BACT|nr:MAG: hypothetical protein COU09_01715 [Candidatus Harrisonbacteria bacterium CG10_big_fil_rev_8_21_14_0_10_44_23]